MVRFREVHRTSPRRQALEFTDLPDAPLGESLPRLPGHSAIAAKTWQTAYASDGTDSGRDGHSTTVGELHRDSGVSVPNRRPDGNRVVEFWSIQNCASRVVELGPFGRPYNPHD